MPVEKKRGIDDWLGLMEAMTLFPIHEIRNVKGRSEGREGWKKERDVTIVKVVKVINQIFGQGEGRGAWRTFKETKFKTYVEMQPSERKKKTYIA